MREWQKNGTLAVVFFLLSALMAEAVMRWVAPWLLPSLSGNSSQSGLRSGWLEQQRKKLHDNAPDLVFVGDSFVKSGLTTEGWISRLKKTTNRRIEALGHTGACPSQYLLIVDELRRAGVTMPIVVVLYIGNDFADESVWASQGSDRSDYESARVDFYADPSRRTFWPCFEIQPESNRPLAWLADGLRRHSAAYRACLLAIGGASGEKGISRFMNDRCDQQQRANRLPQRLFFFRLHNAIVDPTDPAIAQSQSSVLRQLAQRRADRNLAIAPVLDREENCIAFHRRGVVRAAPFIDAVRDLGVKVLDANPELARECAEREIYVPDGHWAAEGHEVFARALGRLLIQEGWLPEGHQHN